MVHSWPFEFMFRINTAQLPIGMEGFRYDEQSVGTKRQDASYTEKLSLFLLKGRERWGGEGRGWKGWRERWKRMSDIHYSQWWWRLHFLEDVQESTKYHEEVFLLINYSTFTSYLQMTKKLMPHAVNLLLAHVCTKRTSHLHRMVEKLAVRRPALLILYFAPHITIFEVWT